MLSSNSPRFSSQLELRMIYFIEDELKNHLQGEHLAARLRLPISASLAEEFPEQRAAELRTEPEAQIPNTCCTIRKQAYSAHS
ncbi:hypothetical protein VZT92_001304 [Zoarces viviparus]|uniref:Uncharacterized protein n=1 Tax=Zoarces viviparus TaxID=48416 RepID=A0AAW1G3T6_ZOAVI